MRSERTFYLSLFAIIVAAGIAACTAQMGSEQSTGAVRIDNDDIGGVVTSEKGPEAGVWVIAETTDLPTRFARMVVTDDQGRYVVPDLPKANYNVWVRGYGLVDSQKVKATPGNIVDLTAVVAPNEAAAAQYYPAIYWYSMLKIPQANEFGGKGKIPAKVTQNQWLNAMRSNGCIGCHQLGQLSTRTFPSNVPHPMGKFANSEEAWFRRIQSGQSGEQMFNQLVKELGGAPISYYADWTDRIAKGELPHTKPARPQGVERNIVVTTWDWLNEKHYLHDLIASDRRYPTVNSYGPVYGSTEYSVDIIPILDPKKHTATNFKATVRDANTPEALGPDMQQATSSCNPRPTGVRRRSGTRRPTTTTACSTEKGECGSQRQCAARAIRTSAKRARPIRPLKSSPWSGQIVLSPCSIQRPKNIHLWTPVFRRIICSLVMTRTKHCGPAEAGRCSAGLTQRCSTRRAMRRNHRAGRL